MIRKKHLLEEKKALEEENQALKNELAFCKQPVNELQTIFEEKTHQFQEAHRKETEKLTADHTDAVTKLEQELSLYREETMALKSSQGEDKKKIRNLQSRVSKQKTEIEAHKKRIKEIEEWDRLLIGDGEWTDGYQHTEELRRDMEKNIELLQKRWGKFHEYVTKHVPSPSPPTSRSARNEYRIPSPFSIPHKDDKDDKDDEDEGVEGVVDDIKILIERITEQSIAMSRRNKYDAKDLRRDAERLRREGEAEKEQLQEEFEGKKEEFVHLKEIMVGKIADERIRTKAHTELIARLVQLIGKLRPGSIEGEIINEERGLFKVWRTLTPDYTPHLWDLVPESEIITLHEGTDLTVPGSEIVVVDGVRYETFNNCTQKIREDAAQKIRELLREEALKHAGEIGAIQQYTDADLTNLKENGKTYRQIAKMTGIKEGTLKARISRFRNQQHEESEDVQV